MDSNRPSRMTVEKKLLSNLSSAPGKVVGVTKTRILWTRSMTVAQQEGQLLHRQKYGPFLGAVMVTKHNRLHREAVAIGYMIGIFCTARHKPVDKLCEECRQVLEHVKQAVDLCPYKEDKPVCGKCATNCYNPAIKQTLQLIMRYAGPRMMVHHPVLALRHCLDAMRTPPPRVE